MALSPDIRIAIADGRPIVRDGLRRLLDSEAGLAVVGDAADGQEAVAIVSQMKPDILLLDVDVPRLSSADVLRALAAIECSVRTILLTRTTSHTDAVAAMTLGVVGVLSEDSPTHLLFKCIRAVMRGEHWVGREAVSGLVEALRRVTQSGQSPRLPRASLTPRERDVIREVTEGATNKDIAAKFALSEQTIKNHLSNIFDKLGVSSRLELALYAVNHRLLDDLPMSQAS
ncbi:MAG TPA: response regulator transcription factor [Vicinamibacterales bacterium]|nr:response regulator transcription factor [Vicinamibacterales bacterium]